MALSGGLGVVFLLGLMCLFIGALLHIIGQSTPEWTVSTHMDSDIYHGLWDECIAGECVKIPAELKDAELQACETFAVLGVMTALAGFAMALVDFVLTILGKRQDKLLSLLVLSTCGICFVCIVICVIVWAGAIHNPQTSSIGYSFILSIIGGILTLSGGILVYVSNARTED